MKTKPKTKMKTKTKTRMKTKMKTKTKMKNKMKTKTKMKIKLNFRFGFCFCFLKVFAFLLTPRGLEVPQTVNSLLIGLEVSLSLSLYLSLSYLAQKCHRIFDCEFSTWPSGAVDGQLSLDWPRSAIAPRNMAPSLIRLCRIQ